MFIINLDQVDELLGVLCKLEAINYLQCLNAQAEHVLNVNDFGWAYRNTPNYLLELQTKYIKMFSSLMIEYFASDTRTVDEQKTI